MSRTDPGGPAFYACTDGRLLDIVSHLIHDCYTTLPAIEIDEGTRILTIPFLMQEWDKGAVETRLAVVRVFHATGLTVKDPARVRDYQLMGVTLDDQSMVLLVVAEPNLLIQVHLDAVDVELEIFSTVGPSWGARKGALGMKVATPPSMEGVAWRR